MGLRLIVKYGILSLIIFLSFTLAGAIKAGKSNKLTLAAESYSLFVNSVIHSFTNLNFKNYTLEGAPKISDSWDKETLKREVLAFTEFEKREQKKRYVFDILCFAASAMMAIAIIPYSSVLIGFRYKIFFYNFAWFCLIIYAFYYILQNNFHPAFLAPISLYPFTQNLGTPIFVLAFLFNIFLIHKILSIILPDLAAVKRLPCPKCFLLMNVKTNWYHDLCGNEQFLGRKRYITSFHFMKCWCFMTKAECPNCGEEFIL